MKLLLSCNELEIKNEGCQRSSGFGLRLFVLTLVFLLNLCAPVIALDNTASGVHALAENTTGDNNTATGYNALEFNTTGDGNTATGRSALGSNTTGYNNIATGYSALSSNTTGFQNTVSGVGALPFNTTGNRNTAMGLSAMRFNTTGSDNIAIGLNAGVNNTTGNNNIWINNQGATESNTTRIGISQTRAFIAGVSGVNVSGASVLVNGSGQIGVASSSARYKEDIHDLGEVSNRLLNLRPVAFRYKADVQEGERPVQYGLIAEEVAEVFPELVIYNKEGKPETVAYHTLSTLLLNELQGVQSRVIELQSTRNENKDRLVVLERELKENKAQMIAWKDERRKKEARLIALEGMVKRLAAPQHHRASFIPAQ